VTAGQVWIPVPNNPKANRYLRQPQRAVLSRKLLAEVSAIPGVQKAAIGVSATVPYLSNVKNTVSFSFADEFTPNTNDRAAEFGSVSPDYFDVLGIPV